MHSQKVTFDELCLVLDFVEPIIQTTTTTVAAQMSNPTKAPGRFPYPLDTIMDDLADAYLQTSNAKDKLKIACSNAALSDEQKERLTLLKDKIAIANKYVIEVANELESRFTLDN